MEPGSGSFRARTLHPWSEIASRGPVAVHQRSQASFCPLERVRLW